MSNNNHNNPSNEGVKKFSLIKKKRDHPPSAQTSQTDLLQHPNQSQGAPRHVHKKVQLQRNGISSPTSALPFENLKVASSPSSPSSPSSSGPLPTSFMHISNLDLALRETLVKECGFSAMTEAQQRTMLPLLLEKDLHLLSKTGSGKTIAFLVPSLQKLIKNRKRSGIKMLVISPTRELALQISKEAELVVSRYKDIKVNIVIGGTNIETDKKRIRNGLDILVATPGRLLDLLSGGNFLHNIDTFVLDECDRLLDMGFAPDVNKIIGYLPKDGRQSILCSATTNPQVEKIVKVLLKNNYEFVSTIPAGESNVHERVPQFVVSAPFKDHLKMTIALIEKECGPTFKAIVFLPTAAAANLYYSVCMSSSILDEKSVFVQHSRQSQSKRIQVTQQFKSSNRSVLFATDVVARGMDFPNVSHVIQVGVADDAETYIHRVGRTGRAGAGGKGFIILASEEMYLPPLLVKQKIPLQQLSMSVSPKIESSVEKSLVRFVKEDQANAAKVYQAWLGFYKSRIKQLQLSPVQLVATANAYALDHFGVVPQLESKTIGKMGLKGTEGLVPLSTGGSGHYGSSGRGRGGGGRGGGSGRGGRGRGQ